jgi:predicted nucleotidyltransferase
LRREALRDLANPTIITTGAPMEPDKLPRESVLKDVVRRVVEAVHPLRIILFGSAARGEMGPHSDLDLLIVIPDDVPFSATEDRVWSSLRGLGHSRDVVVVTRTDFEAQASNPCLVVYHALREGKELYRAA